MPRLSGEHPGPISRIPGPDKVGLGMGVPQGPMTSAEHFGANKYNDLYKLGQAGQQFFNTQMQLSIQRDHQRQSVEATEMTLEYKRAANAKLAELEQTEGLDAAEVENIFQEWDSENRILFGRTVNSGLAGKLYKQHTDEIFTTGMGRMSSHRAQQAKVDEYRTIDNVKQAIVEDVKSDWRSIANNLDAMQNAIYNEGTIKGWKDEETKFKLELATISLAETAVASMVNDPNAGFKTAVQFLESDEGKTIEKILGPARFAAALGKKKLDLYASAEAKEKTVAKLAVDDLVRNMRQSNPEVTEQDLMARVIAEVNVNGWWEVLSYDDIVGAVGRVAAQTTNYNVLTEQQQALMEKNTVNEWVYGPEKRTVEELSTMLESPNAFERRLAKKSLAEIDARDSAVDSASALQGRQAVNRVLRDNRTEINALLDAGELKKASAKVRTYLGDVWNDAGIRQAYNAWLDSSIASYGDRAEEADRAKENKRLEQENTKANLTHAETVREHTKLANDLKAKYKDRGGVMAALNSPELKQMSNTDATMEAAEFVGDYLWASIAKTNERQEQQQKLKAAEYAIDPTEVGKLLSTTDGRRQLLNEVGFDEFNKLNAKYVSRLNNTEEYKTGRSLLTQIDEAIKSQYNYYTDSDEKAIADSRTLQAHVLYDSLVDAALSLEGVSSIDKLSKRGQNDLVNRVVNMNNKAFGGVRKSSEIKPTVEGPTGVDVDTLETIDPVLSGRMKRPVVHGWIVKDPQDRDAAMSLVSKIKYVEREYWENRRDIAVDDPQYRAFMDWYNNKSTSEQVSSFLEGTAPIRDLNEIRRARGATFTLPSDEEIQRLKDSSIASMPLGVAAKQVAVWNPNTAHYEQTGFSPTDAEIPLGAKEFIQSIGVSPDITFDLNTQMWIIEYTDGGRRNRAVWDSKTGERFQ